MTYREFYSELRKLRGKYHLDSGKQIRAINEDATGYCPIVGVSKKKGGPDSYWDGGLFLGLREQQIATIVNAADYNMTNSPAKKVRLGLLKTLGLKEGK